jgi:predicted PurR-regulated permease PerM
MARAWHGLCARAVPIGPGHRQHAGPGQWAHTLGTCHGAVTQLPPNLASGAVERRQPRRQEDRRAELLGSKLYRAIGLLFLIAIVLYYFDPLARAALLGFVSVILAIALNAAVVRIPMSRGRATVVVALATLALIAVSIWFVVSFLAAQVRSLIQDMPALFASLEEWEEWVQQRIGIDLELVGPYLQAALDKLVGGVDGGRVVTGAFGIIEIIALSILVLIGAFFAVGKPDRGLIMPLMRVVPPERRPAFVRMFTLLGERIASWIWGTFIASVAVGGLSVLVFWLLGTPYPLLLGTLVGITNVVPMIGPWIGGAVAVIVTLVFNPGLALWVALAVLGIQEIESNLVRPFVMSGVAKLHPFPTLLALLLFTSMFGVLGAILSLPLLIVIGTAVEVLWVEEVLGDYGDVEPIVDK